MDMGALIIRFKSIDIRFHENNMNSSVQFSEPCFRALTHMGSIISALTAKSAQKIAHILGYFRLKLQNRA